MDVSSSVKYLHSFASVLVPSLCLRYYAFIYLAQLAFNFNYGEFSEEQQEVITDTLRQFFCYKHSRVWEVLNVIYFHYSYSVTISSAIKSIIIIIKYFILGWLSVVC